MRGKYQIVLLALLACTVLIAPISARAATELGMTFTSGASVTTVCDNNPGPGSGCAIAGGGTLATDLNGAAGQITFIGPVGGWDTNVTSGFGPPHLNLKPLLDIAYADMSSQNGASALTILLTVTGLNGPGFPLGVLSALNQIGGTITNGNISVTTQAWISAANNWFCANAGCGSALTNALTLTGSPYSGTSTGTGNTGTGPYSITLALTFDNHGLAGGTTGDDQLDIPEPATLSVIGTGLLALGTGLRKRLLRA